MGIKAALLAAAIALVAAVPAAASRTAPLRGVVVGQSGGLVLVAAANGKVTAVPGHAALGTHVVLTHGRLVRAGVARHASTVTFVSIGRHVLEARVAAHDRQPGAAGRVEIEGVVTSVGTGTVTLTVDGQSLTIPLPAGVTVPASAVGGKVELELSFAGAVVRDDDEDDDAPATTTTTTMPTTTVAQFDDGDGHRDGGHGDGGHGGGGR